MSELPTARHRSTQNSDIFLAAVTGSANLVTDSCASTEASTVPSVSAPAEDTNEARCVSRATSCTENSLGIQTHSDHREKSAVALLAPPASQISPQLPPPPASQLTLPASSATASPATLSKISSVVPRLQLALPTGVVLESHQRPRFSTPMSARVVSSSGPFRASPRVLATVSSHRSTASVNSASREVSVQAAPSRSVSMQSCHSTMSTPLPHLLGVHRRQPEVKSKLLD